MPATSVTRSYTTVPAITLDKMSGFISDNVSKSNALLLAYKEKGNYKTVASGGDRARVPVMYEFGNIAVRSGFGLIDTTPPDGITDAFYDWAQFDGAIVVHDGLANIFISLNNAARTTTAVSYWQQGGGGYLRVGGRPSTGPADVSANALGVIGVGNEAYLAELDFYSRPISSYEQTLLYNGSGARSSALTFPYDTN